jgi:riboflavin synthase
MPQNGREIRGFDAAAIRHYGQGSTMFTGLVETKGSLVRRTRQDSDARLVVEGALDVAHSPVELGESIAVDGVCLTVAAIVSPANPTVFEVDASAETLAKTTLGDLAIGAHVNLERAVPLGGRMGGHIVSGHVDGVGRIASRTPVGAALKVVFEAPRELMKFIAPKGSITVSGVSLTVNGVSGDRFDVVLVPHTQDKTSLEALGVGAPVNLEVDLLARYVARLLEAGKDASSSDASWMDRLTRAGYV